MVDHGQQGEQQPHSTDAVYEGGVLRPDHPLPFKNHQRVRVLVQAVATIGPEERAAAFDAFEAGVRRMNFRSKGAYPTRDELHERG